jgi:hypothetical protein
MAPRHDRTYLLRESKRNDVLALWEVERYGRDSFGDPDYVSVYGLKPAEWHALGVRSLEDVRHRRARPQPRPASRHPGSDAVTRYETNVMTPATTNAPAHSRSVFTHAERRIRVPHVS